MDFDVVGLEETASVCESERALANIKAEGYSSELTSIPSPSLYASSLNRRDVNRYPPLFHLAQPRENKRRIVSALYIGKSKKENDTPLPQDAR